MACRVFYQRWLFDPNCTCCLLAFTIFIHCDSKDWITIRKEAAPSDGSGAKSLLFSGGPTKKQPGTQIRGWSLTRQIKLPVSTAWVQLEDGRTLFWLLCRWSCNHKTLTETGETEKCWFRMDATTKCSQWWHHWNYNQFNWASLRSEIKVLRASLGSSHLTARLDSKTSLSKTWPVTCSSFDLFCLPWREVAMLWLLVATHSYTKYSRLS